MIATIKYSIKAPENVRHIAKAFKNKIKSKISLRPNIILKKAKEGKPSDLDLVFCPVVSRTGTDIDAALSKIEDNKQAILVVLHHTFDTDVVVSKSSKFVEKENVQTVDCLFYEDKGLLDCKQNNEAYKEAAEWLVSNRKKLAKHPAILKKSSGKSQEAETNQQDRSPKDGPSNAEDHRNNE